MDDLLLGRYRPTRAPRHEKDALVVEARDLEAGNATVEVRIYQRPPGAAAAGGRAWRLDTRAWSRRPEMSVTALSAPDADYLVLQRHPDARKPRRRTTPSKGFIYALEAITVLGVLLFFHVAVADPFTQDTQLRAEWQACLGGRRALATAIQMYRNEQEAFPRSLDVLAPKYLRKLPTCPRGGSWMGYPDDPQSWTCSRCGAMRTDP